MKKRAEHWFEYNVQQNFIKSIPWSEIKKDSNEYIGTGMSKAYWQNIHSYVTLKKRSTGLSDQRTRIWEEFKHELHMQIRVHSCENIVRILGVSKGMNEHFLF